MANILLLNKPQVNIGLDTMTHTIKDTGLYSVLVSVTVPMSLATGAGAGSGADQGDGVTGGLAGANQALQTLSNGQTGLGQSFPNVPANSAPGIDPTTMPESTPNLPSVALGSGALGLGFGPGLTSDNASGNGSGHGNGAGGGDEAGFAEGGTSETGGVGQGFGPLANNYPQPPLNVVVPTSQVGQASSLVITVLNGVTLLYTAPALTPTQRALQFKVPVVANAADVITVVFTSSSQNDKDLQAVKSLISIQQGL